MGFPRTCCFRAASEIARSFSGQRFGAAAHCLGVSLALAKAASCGKFGSPYVYLESSGSQTIGGGNVPRSPSQGASLAAIRRSGPPEGALHVSGRSAFHGNIDEDHCKRAG